MVIMNWYGVNLKLEQITRTLHDRMSVNKTMEGSKIVICRNRLSDLRLITDLSTVGDTIAAYR